MEIPGRVKNGVVILEGDASLPDGTVVTVLFQPIPPTDAGDSGSRVALPLVPSHRPGSRRLTAERVAELLDDGDVPA
jgi:hypothetical protein